MAFARKIWFRRALGAVLLEYMAEIRINLRKVRGKAPFLCSLYVISSIHQSAGCDNDCVTRTMFTANSLVNKFLKLVNIY